MKKQPEPLKNLNLTSRFLFDEVMEDVETLKDALSIIFEREIPLLLQTETEKELRVSPLLRSIRLDVITMDTDRTVYSTEMQNEKKDDLAKRSGYYQALARIFLNTKGTNEEEVSKELVEFLHYIENTTDKAAEDSESERIRRI